MLAKIVAAQRRYLDGYDCRDVDWLGSNSTHANGVGWTENLDFREMIRD
jgi:hypothetical protein